MNLKTLKVIVLAVALTVGISAQVSAGERIGDLVFDAMKKIDTRQKDFNKEVQQFRENREKAVREKEEIKKGANNVKEGSLEEKELHGKLSLVVTKIYKETFSELRLVRDASQDHIQSLRILKDGFKNGSVGLDPKTTEKIAKDTGSFLSSSNNLLKSIGEYKDMIKDPVINQKLNSAFNTANFTQNYIKNMENNQIGVDSTREALQIKIEGLITRLEELYIQTDVLLDMVKSQATLLNMINQISITELATMRLTNGKTVIDSISKEVLDPINQILKDTDNDLATLAGGINLGGTPQGSGKQSWAEGLK